MMENEKTDRQELEDLCHELNLDDATSERAWHSYQKIRVNYTLEGDCLVWLTCAVYAASRLVVLPTVCNGTMEGNCTSLTRLLKYSKLSLVQFFAKMKNWSDMANLPRKFRDKVDRLERNFSVSTVIFKKFQPIFNSIFRITVESPKPPRSRKQRRPPCSSTEVFAFCWDLFVLAKGNFPAISDDLVNSYHLLLCCVDLLFANAVLANRRNLLRHDFAGLPPGFHTEVPDGDRPTPCIIEHLCKVHEGLIVEAKGIKEHYWKPYLQAKMEAMILHGDPEDLSGLLDPGNFERNCNSVRREYDEFVLKKGDFDERVFLEEDAHEQIGTPSKALAAGNMTEEVSARRALHLERHSQDLIPPTPLTNRRYLREKETRITPVSSATQTVSRLQALLSGQKSCPSENLLEIFKSCNEDPKVAIEERVKEMGQTFCDKYTKPSDQSTGSPLDFAKRRLTLAQSLYYSVLEKIAENEKQRLPEKQDLSGLLGHDIFHRCLFACCVEIIIFAYNSQRVFPWVLDAFSLDGYYFYRVIELLLRAEEALPRDIVKQLNRTEEVILQERAWSSDSPLWQAIEDCNGDIPTCADCTPPSQVETASPTQGSVMPQTLVSPVPHRRIQELSTVNPQLKQDVLSSPASARDRFSSPTPGAAKRRLFSGTPAPSQTTAAPGSSGQVIRNVVKATTPSVLHSPARQSSSASVSAPSSPAKVPTSSSASAPTTPVKTQTVILTIKGQSRQIMSNKDGNIQTIHSPIRLAEPGQKLILVRTGGPSGTTTVIPQSKLANIAPSPKPPVTQPPPAQPANPSQAGMTYVRPRRTGSLGMFFRKVYHLLNIRVRDICLKLRINEELQRKIWTCLEHSLVNHVDLMKDRHIDQLMLCAFYIMCRVTGNTVSFHDIIKCYRRQPQAVSHVYRSVFLSRKDPPQKSMTTRSGTTGSLPQTPEKQKDKSRSRMATLKASDSAPPTPSRMSGTSTSFDQEVRGDLVKFYNEVYESAMNGYAKRFQVGRDTTQADEPPLSPLPRIRSHLISPRKVSRKHELYVSPHKKPPGYSDSPTKVMRYLIQKSPSKNLCDINRMVRTRERAHNKRALQLVDNTESPSKKTKLDNNSSGSIARRLHDLKSKNLENI